MSETSVAVLKNDTELLSNVIASQIESHKTLRGSGSRSRQSASCRSHYGLYRGSARRSGNYRKDITAVAVTYGPGLVGALLVGLAAAKAFAWAHGIPLIPVNHMAGHLMAAQSVEPWSSPC